MTINNLNQDFENAQHALAVLNQNLEESIQQLSSAEYQIQQQLSLRDSRTSDTEIRNIDLQISEIQLIKSKTQDSIQTIRKNIVQNEANLLSTQAMIQHSLSQVQ